MQLAVSNIAWTPNDRIKTYGLLAELGFSGLEIAPGLFFHSEDNPFTPTDSAVQRALNEIHDVGLTLVSMQSLLFGVEGAALFAGEGALSRFERGIEQAIILAGRLDIPNLVFGSPKQRCIPDSMDSNDAWLAAVDVFRRLGDKAQAAGTVISIESNPAAYGTNFLNTLEEANDFVIAVDHPGVSVILDIGAMHMNEQFDNLDERIENIGTNLKHVHISEPELAPAPAQESHAREVFKALNAAGYNRAVSIEMRTPESGLDELRACAERLAHAASQEGIIF